MTQKQAWGSFAEGLVEAGMLHERIALSAYSCMKPEALSTALLCR
jgi:hypothetical protein